MWVATWAAIEFEDVGILFLSTPPVWVATTHDGPHYTDQRSFYPRHPCGWRRREFYRRRRRYLVSIHATRVGGDDTGGRPDHELEVSIHATRVGGDVALEWMKEQIEKFLSTPPVWVATLPYLAQNIRIRFLSTPPVWVATPAWKCRSAAIAFLSTPPVWVATAAARLREVIAGCFYPRHPCGWRRTEAKVVIRVKEFLSTPPVWVATRQIDAVLIAQPVSIHATRVGGDPAVSYLGETMIEFLSTR